MSWRRQVAVVSIVALLVGPTFAPELLAFPYSASSNGHRVYSEGAIDQDALDTVTARSNALVARSPLAEPAEPRTVFLTSGGWRWKWLALAHGDAFAISRPGRETIVMNRVDLARDRTIIDRDVGDTRTVSGTLAHEVCHGMQRRHFGFFVDWRKPTWVREGYCDHVAGESALSDADAKRLKDEGEDHPALPYYDGRRRVAAELERNGNDVDALFDSAS